jgi:hypothetical protein
MLCATPVQWCSCLPLAHTPASFTMLNRSSSFQHGRRHMRARTCSQPSAWSMSSNTLESCKMKWQAKQVSNPETSGGHVP